VPGGLAGPLTRWASQVGTPDSPVWDLGDRLTTSPSKTSHILEPEGGQEQILGCCAMEEEEKEY
jgi:hypothetical protein